VSAKQGIAFITTKKGFCYLTIKYNRRNFPLMRIRKYTIEAEDKRRMRRLHPDILFDWKKIAAQLAEKRQVCRAYRAKGRTTASRSHEPFYGVIDPSSRTVYVNDPSNMAGVGALLDALLSRDRLQAQTK
jgi:hypothetical protein